MLLFTESGPKKGLSGNGFTKTVTPHLRSIVPNVQRHMASLPETWPVCRCFPSWVLSSLLRPGRHPCEIKNVVGTEARSGNDREVCKCRQMAHNKCRGARGPEQTQLPSHGSGACEESCKGLGSVSLKINTNCLKSGGPWA